MKKAFTSALSDIKNNPKILGCSAVYCIFLMLLAFLRFHILESIYSIDASSLMCKLLYQLASFITYIFEILLLSAFVYMITKKKFKFKRFFSFFHKKNLQYDIPFIAAVALPIAVINALFKYAANNGFIFAGYVAAFIFFILDLIKDAVICSKAKCPFGGFKEIYTQSVASIRHNIGKIIIFELCLIPIILIINGLSMGISDQIPYPDLEVAAESVYCGLKVFYPPFYMLSLSMLIFPKTDTDK